VNFLRRFFKSDHSPPATGRTRSSKPIPLPTSSSDPFINKVVENGDHAANGIEGLYGFFRMGLMDAPAFFGALVKEEVLIVCTDRQDVNSALFLKHPDGSSRLAFFTSPERAKKVVIEHPAYRFCFEVAVAGLIKGLPANAGFVMNPFDEAITLQATPEQARHICTDFIGSAESKM
jgi:hypothetical protein